MSEASQAATAAAAVGGHSTFYSTSPRAICEMPNENFGPAGSSDITYYKGFNFKVLNKM